MKISAVILTKNNEDEINEAIESVSFCDEIIVIDDFSNDQTIGKIKDNPKVKIFQKKLDGDFSLHRNLGLEKASSEWVLFLDSDERIDDALRNEISEFLTYRSENYDGVLVKRIDHLWGKNLNYGETGNIQLLRLGRKNKGVWSGKVHETWDINGKKYLLLNPLLHFPHKNIDEFLKKIDYYSDLRSEELYKKGVKSGFLQVIIYPKAKFIKNYLIKQGFRDGVAGFIHAMLMSFHSFMVRGKLWQLWKEN